MLVVQLHYEHHHSASTHFTKNVSHACTITTRPFVAFHNFHKNVMMFLSVWCEQESLRIYFPTYPTPSLPFNTISSEQGSLLFFFFLLHAHTLASLLLAKLYLLNFSFMWSLFSAYPPNYLTVTFRNCAVLIKSGSDPLCTPSLPLNANRWCKVNRCCLVASPRDRKRQKPATNSVLVLLMTARALCWTS